MELCKEGQVSTIIVFSFSRFARSTVHLLEALNFFHEHNIAFISLSEKLDTSTAMGRAVFTIISAISQLERELISERVKNGLKNAAAKGKQIGRPKTVNTKLIKELLLQENYTYEKIAELANCGSSSVGRIARYMKNQKAS
jgi:DNA invertase Pin-like site-specific DNA recombinase